MPYWNENVVAKPFGLTVPVRSAEVDPAAEAAPVLTVGGVNVLNVWSASVVVPVGLVARIW